MKKNALIWLIVAALLATAVAWFVSSARAPGDSADANRGRLVPALADALNDVTGIAIVAADGAPAITLTRGESAWQVAERGGYPADTGKVRKYLLDLADATLVEAKTARPENYGALGVTTPGEDGATGTRVTIDGIAGSPSFVVGNAARGGSYVRRIDETQSWLSNVDVSVATDAADWLDRDIMDIDSADVVRVQIRHPDGEVVAARRGEVNLQLDVLPEGKVPTGPAAVNPLAGVLADLRFDDVQPAGQFASDDLEPVAATWTTVDGVVVDATLYEREGERFARFDVHYAEPDPQTANADQAPGGEEGDDSASTADNNAPGAADARADDAAAARARAERLAARTSGWVYMLPTSRYQQMTRRNDAFLRDAEPAE